MSISISRSLSEQQWEQLLALFNKDTSLVSQLLENGGTVLSLTQLRQLNSLAILEDQVVCGGIVIRFTDYWNRNAQTFVEIGQLRENSIYLLGMAVQEFFFSELNLHRVYWITKSLNETTMRKMGASMEGYTFMHDDKVHLYSFLSEEQSL